MNWTGKAVAGPQSEFDSVLARNESINSGIYFLTRYDPESGNSIDWYYWFLCVFCYMAEQNGGMVVRQVDKVEFNI